MTIDWQTLALAFLSSNGVMILLTWLVSRRKSHAEINKLEADTDDTRVGTALRLVDELQEQLIEDRNRFREYRQSTDETIANLMAELKALMAELKAQEKAIDNLTAKTLKYQLVLSILIMQLRLGGLEPLVDPQEIDAMKIDDLRIIARGMSNVEARRLERQRGADR